MSNIMTSGIMYGDISDYLPSLRWLQLRLNNQKVLKTLMTLSLFVIHQILLLMSLLMTLRKGLINSICLTKCQVMKFLINLLIYF